MTDPNEPFPEPRPDAGTPRWPHPEVLDEAWDDQSSAPFALSAYRARCKARLAII